MFGHWSLEHRFLLLWLRLIATARGEDAVYISGAPKSDCVSFSSRGRSVLFPSHVHCLCPNSAESAALANFSTRPFLSSDYD
ncbi:hypothetical protein F5Y13DRAFT_92746 [Hypoxylon sp. FL1857]|nr:hypothetical protein F5Y13DRAFT_92746 [Hypoxylon sp. FL1857]